VGARSNKEACRLQGRLACCECNLGSEFEDRRRRNGAVVHFMIVVVDPAAAIGSGVRHDVVRLPPPTAHEKMPDASGIAEPPPTGSMSSLLFTTNTLNLGNVRLETYKKSVLVGSP